ncbi:MAG: SDR family oxidoreductase [Candidatus Acetothermia bacterium]
MREEFAGRTAMVTGGACRIGREIALKLGEMGVDVVVHYRSSARAAEELKRELKGKGVEAWTLKATFGEEADYSEIMSEVTELSGGLDFLVNNASIFSEGGLEDLEFSDLRRNLAVNAWAPFALARAFTDEASTGKIVNLLDTRIEGYDWNHLGYYFSKVLLGRMTKAMAIYEAPEFSVNGVAPGLIIPPPGRDEDYLEKRTDRVPLRKHGDKADVSKAVLYLLGADFVTGQVIYVDGGRNLLHELEG